MADTARVSRRLFLGGIAGVAATAILAACGGDSAPAPTTAAGGASPAATGGAANPFGSPAAATATRPAAAATTAPAATGAPASTTTAAGSATTGTTAPSTTGTSAAGGTAPAIVSTGKMTYWGGLIFSDDANKLQSDTIKEWGKQNKIDIDVVMINQNETNQKVAAAIESNTMPDAFDLGLDLLLLQSAKLLPLDDLYKKIGDANGGWLASVDKALDPKFFGGTRNGIPYGMGGGNLLFRRTDALTKVGITAAPKTWQEVKDAAEKVNKPPLYGMGFALSNVGDGNVQVQVLQSFGGRVADDEGKKCVIKSDATKTYMEWITDAYKKGLFPPGVTTWDGAGDNNGYQAGQLAFIANTGSVTIWMRANDKDLLNNTQYSAMPIGPKLRVSPASPQLRGIPKTSKNIEASKALFEYLSKKEFTSKYYPLAIYGPVLQSETTQDLFKTDPVHQGLADLGLNGTAPAFPDVNNAAYADFNNNFLVPKMIQRVVIDKLSVDQAIDETQKAGDAIYAKYAK